MILGRHGNHRINPFVEHRELLADLLMISHLRFNENRTVPFFYFFYSASLFHAGSVQTQMSASLSWIQTACKIEEF